MEENKVNEIKKNYQNREKAISKIGENKPYMEKMEEIKTKKVRNNQIKLHIERLQEEMESVSDFQVKEEYQVQIAKSEEGLQKGNEELEKLEQEKEKMVLDKKREEKGIREYIYNKVNEAQDQTRKELMQQKKQIEVSMQETKINYEMLKLKIQSFQYEYDEKGTPTNGEDFRKLQEEMLALTEKNKKLEEMSHKCDTYRNKLITPYKMPPELPDDKIYIGYFQEKQKEAEKEKLLEDMVKGREQRQEERYNETIQEAVKEEKEKLLDDMVKGREQRQEERYNEMIQEAIQEERNKAKQEEERKALEPDRVEYISISEQDGTIFFGDNKGNDRTVPIKEAFETQKDKFKRLDIYKKCREVAGGYVRGLLLKRKVNPEIVMALDGYEDQLKEYITSIHKEENLPFGLKHNLSGMKILDKIKRNKFAKIERKLGATVLGKLFDKNEALEAAKKEEVKSKETKKEQKPIDEYRNIIDEKTQAQNTEKILKEQEEQTAKDVQRFTGDAVLDENDNEIAQL